MPYDLNMPDGTTIQNIPDDVDPKVAGNKYLLKFGGKPAASPFTPEQQQSLSNLNLPAGVQVGNALKLGAGQSLPAIGSLAGPLGTVAGSLIKSALPEEYGGTTDVGNVVGNLGEDLLANEALPRVGSSLLKLGKTAVQEGPRAAIASILATKPFSSNPSIQNAIKASTANETTDILNRFGNQEDSINQDLINRQTGLVNKLPSMVYNPAERSQLNQLISKGYSPSANTIDPDKILKEMDNPKSDYSALQTETKNNVTQLMQAVKEAQITRTTASAANEAAIKDVNDAAKPSSSNLLSYTKHRLVFELPFLLGGAAAGHELIGAGAAASIILGDKAISKLMENPMMAKLTVAAAKSSTKNPAAPLLQQAILRGLGNGTEVYLNLPDGTQEKAVMQDGKPVLPQPAQ